MVQHAQLIPAPHAALASLQLALTALHTRTPRPAIHVPFDAPAAQAFARLALSTSIIWHQVRAALEAHYASSGGQQRRQLAGDFGVALVHRVLARFEHFAFARDQIECENWCRALEEQIWRAVEAHGGQRLQQQHHSNGYDEQHQGGPAQGSQANSADQRSAYSHAFSQTRGGNSASLSQQQVQQIQGPPQLGFMHDQPYHPYAYPLPHQQQYPMVDSAPSPARSQSQVSEAEPEGRRLRQSSKRAAVDEDLIDGGEEIEEDVKPRIVVRTEDGASGATSTPGKGAAKDRIPAGGLVLAKMHEPREKGVQVPAMVFDHTVGVPEKNVHGKQVASSYLVAPIGVKNEWHWIPVSRINVLRPARISKLLIGYTAESKKLRTELAILLGDASLNENTAYGEGKRRNVDQKKQQIAVQDEGKMMAELLAEDQSEELQRWREGRERVLQGEEEPESDDDVGEGTSSMGDLRRGSMQSEALTPATEVVTDAQEPHQVWCVCGDTYIDETLIGCDSKTCAYHWFHPACVGVDPASLPLPEDEPFICPGCSGGGYHSKFGVYGNQTGSAASSSGGSSGEKRKKSKD